MDVLYMQTYNQQFYGHVLGIFTRNAEPSQIETTADAFVGKGLLVRAAVPSSISIQKAGLGSNVVTLTIQVQQGDFPQVGDRISVQGTTGGTFDGTFYVTNVNVSASTVQYALTSSNVATALNAGTVTILYPEPADFVIPSSYIGLFHTGFGHEALASPLDYAAIPTTGTPSGVQPPSGGAVTVTVTPPTYSVTFPAGPTGHILILFVTGATAVPITPPIPPAGPPVSGNLPATLTPGTTYRAVVFVPGSAMVVSGSFTP